MSEKQFEPESTSEDTAEESSPTSEEPPAERYWTSSEDKSREELATAKEYAEMIVNTIREALLVLDLDLRVISANRSFYATFETRPEHTEGKLVYELGEGQWDIPELRRLLEAILPEEKSFDDFEVAHDFAGIGHRVMLLNARQLDHHGLILLAIDDVTERRRSEHRLRESQERFDLLAHNAVEYAIFIMDEDTRITMWNPGAERILGWSEEEIIGETGDVIFTPEDREAGIPEEELAKAIENGSAKDDRWHIRKDGSRFWATGFMIAFDDEKQLQGFAKILRDDTDDKKAEEERKELIDALEAERRELRELNETLEKRVEERTKQVRSLASTLTMAEQRERRRISQILHDDMQQILYAVQLKMTQVRQSAQSGDRERLESEAAQVEKWTRSAIETTRRLTVDLSPPLLEGEGLADALLWLGTQMEEVYGLKVDLQPESGFPMEDKDIRVLLFQIVRELLFNVVKHADTESASVALERLDGHFAIHVSDEGVGFNVAEAEQRSKSEYGFGLFSVRERLSLFGGRMEIDSAPGEGTRITIYTPAVLEPSDSEPGDGE